MYMLFTSKIIVIIKHVNWLTCLQKGYRINMLSGLHIYNLEEGLT